MNYSFGEKSVSTSLNVEIKKLSENAKVPTRGTIFAAGYDLYAAENFIIKPLSRQLVKTNISIGVPEGFYGRIAPRSGLAYKNGIDVLAGVIDSDYRGDIGVILFNTDVNKDFEVKAGDRIAQLIIEKCFNASWLEVENLNDTQRSSGGFGSTGV
jgi:dUTP pyrophosphatase